MHTPASIFPPVAVLVDYGIRLQTETACRAPEVQLYDGIVKGPILTAKAASSDEKDFRVGLRWKVGHEPCEDMSSLGHDVGCYVVSAPCERFREGGYLPAAYHERGFEVHCVYVGSVSRPGGTLYVYFHQSGAVGPDIPYGHIRKSVVYKLKALSSGRNGQYPSECGGRGPDSYHSRYYQNYGYDSSIQGLGPTSMIVGSA